MSDRLDPDRFTVRRAALATGVELGGSDLAPDGSYDVAAHAMDLHALVYDVLGHEHCFVAGGDAGKETPRFLETNPVPALVLYGPEDNVVPRSFPDRCRVAFTEALAHFFL